MPSSDSVREFGAPAAAALVFLIVDSSGHIPELALTAFIICVTLATFALKDNPGEPWLFLAGVAIGAFIEIGLRIFGYQQVWTQGSLAGVPYWLPIAWGVGFVLITRLGIRIRNISSD